MELETLKYKMRDTDGQKLDHDVVLWGLRKKQPISIQVLSPSSKSETPEIYKFESYEDAYKFVLPDGRSVKKMIDALTAEDFKTVLY